MTDTPASPYYLESMYLVGSKRSFISTKFVAYSPIIHYIRQSNVQRAYQ